MARAKKWYVDPVRGNDAARGTREDPLETFGELMRRLEATASLTRGRARRRLEAMASSTRVRPRRSSKLAPRFEIELALRSGLLRGLGIRP